MTTLNILGAVAAVLVLLIAGGSGWLALRDGHRDARAARRQRAEQRPPTAPQPASRRNERPAWARYTPPRTGLKPYSPEVIAVLLLALAAGLWLARLVS